MRSVASSNLKRIGRWLLLSFIPIYGVFLSLPFVTDVGYEYLRTTAEKSKSDMRRLAGELEKFHVQYGRYPNPSTSSWITDASLTVEGKEVFFIAPGMRGAGIFDLFIADAYTQPFRYYSDGETWFILASNGPDQDEDVTAEVLRQFTKPSYEAFLKWIYNPDNGYRSGGDVIVTSGDRENNDEKN